MSQLRKIVKVEPVPREHPLGVELQARISELVSDTFKFEDLVEYESFTVTYSCGHTETYEEYLRTKQPWFSRSTNGYTTNFWVMDFTVSNATQTNITISIPHP